MDKKNKDPQPQDVFEIDFEDTENDSDEDYVSVNDVVYQQKSKQKRKHSTRNQYYGE